MDISRELLLTGTHYGIPVLSIGVSFVLALLAILPSTRDEEFIASTSRTPAITYDFIVVGSGPGGGVVATRLAEVDSTNILLLEEGGIPEPESYVPGFALLFSTPQSYWSYKTVPQINALLAFENNQDIYRRGRVLGGFSTINHMVHTRGNKRDFDKWLDLGNEGWGFDDVLPYFKKFEDFKGLIDARNERFRGRGGPISIRTPSFSTSVGNAFLEAGKELGYSTNYDYNAEEQIGFSRPNVNIRNGMRSAVAREYIRPNIKKKNLDILANAQVTKILFNEQKRAIGVQFSHKNEEKVAYARKEVIVSAGIFESPKLLMLSGIGPKEHLESFKIPVINDIPGVGQNLHDHIFSYAATAEVDKGKSYSFDTAFLNFSALVDYVINKEGPYSVVPYDGIAFTRVSEGDPYYPEIQVYQMAFSLLTKAAIYNNASLGLKQDIFEEYYGELAGKESINCLTDLLHPVSRGSVTLQSSNPFDNPVIDPNFLSDKKDAEVLAKGAKFCFQILKTKAMAKLGTKVHEKPFPSCKNLTFGSDDYWQCYVRNMATATGHSVGTCKMAPASDPMGVVDNRLRVRGVTGLRVVDASIMPFVTSGNINAPVLMIGEKAADLIKEDHGFVADLRQDDVETDDFAKESADIVKEDYANTYADIIRDYNIKPADLIKVILGEKIIGYINGYRSKIVDDILKEIYGERIVDPAWQSQLAKDADPAKLKFYVKEVSGPIKEVKNEKNVDQIREYDRIKSARPNKANLGLKPTYFT